MNDKIIEAAYTFLNQKEIPENAGWQDKSFEAKMISIGWRYGQAWCAYFAELVWKYAYADNPFMVQRLDALFNGSAMKTYSNFKESEFKVDKTPEKGSVVIWNLFENGEPTWKGHAGIVINCEGVVLSTIEGNTGNKNQREGDGVYEKTRLLDFINKENGLTLVGFIHPLSLCNY